MVNNRTNTVILIFEFECSRFVSHSDEVEKRKKVFETIKNVYYSYKMKDWKFDKK